jgi:hypothetical protein
MFQNFHSQTTFFKTCLKCLREVQRTKLNFLSYLGSTQPLIQWVLGALSPGVKRQGREADNSPPAGAEVKKMWIYTSTPPYTFMA